MSEPPPWIRRALCIIFADDVEFTPDPFLGQSSKPAKSVCALCPVKTECQSWRDRHVSLGVMGGEDEADFIIRRGIDSAGDCGECSEPAKVVTTGLGSVCTACGKVAE